jgi:hypothetical protein
VRGKETPDLDSSALSAGPDRVRVFLPSSEKGTEARAPRYLECRTHCRRSPLQSTGKDRLHYRLLLFRVAFATCQVPVQVTAESESAAEEASEWQEPEKREKTGSPSSLRVALPSSQFVPRVQQRL